MVPQPAAYQDVQPTRIPPGSRVRVQRRFGVARVLSSVLLVSVVLLILVVTVGMALGAWRFTVIDTGSMRPTLNPGDVAVLTPEPTSKLERGQIVAFHPPGESRLTGIHRGFSLQRTRGPV